MEAAAPSPGDGGARRLLEFFSPGAIPPYQGATAHAMPLGQSLEPEPASHTLAPVHPSRFSPANPGREGAHARAGLSAVRAASAMQRTTPRTVRSRSLVSTVRVIIVVGLLLGLASCNIRSLYATNYTQHLARVSQIKDSRLTELWPGVVAWNCGELWPDRE